MADEEFPLLTARSRVSPSPSLSQQPSSSSSHVLPSGSVPVSSLASLDHHVYGMLSPDAMMLPSSAPILGYRQPSIGAPGVPNGFPSSTSGPSVGTAPAGTHHERHPSRVCPSIS
jgi:hypothetical protein